MIHDTLPESCVRSNVSTIVPHDPTNSAAPTGVSVTESSWLTSHTLWGDRELLWCEQGQLASLIRTLSDGDPRSGFRRPTTHDGVRHMLFPSQFCTLPLCY